MARYFYETPFANTIQTLISTTHLAQFTVFKRIYRNLYPQNLAVPISRRIDDHQPLTMAMISIRFGFYATDRALPEYF